MVRPSLICLLLLSLNVTAHLTGNATRPIVFYHGFFGNCADLEVWMNYMKNVTYNSVPIKCIPIGTTEKEQKIDGVIKPMTEQVAIGCQKLLEDEDFMSAPEIDIIGISQGGLVSRAVIEGCEGIPKVHNYITFGGPHRGISAFPAIHGFWEFLLNRALGHLANTEYFQDKCSPCGYFRTYWNLDRYYNISSFLPKLNNEVEMTSDVAVKNKERMTSIDRFILIKWLNDTIVEPRDSEWFGIRQGAYGRQIIQMRDTDFYKDDLIGMKTLDEAGKLWFYGVLGQHLFITPEYVDDYVMPFILDKPELASPTHY